ILERREEGVALTRQAVLFRAAHNSDALEVELGHRNIPFVKWGGLRFLEAAHIKDLLAFLRILENPRDKLSWMRVLQLLDGIGPGRARQAIEHVQQSQDGPRSLLTWKAPAASRRAVDDLARYFDFDRVEEAHHVVVEKGPLELALLRVGGRPAALDASSRWHASASTSRRHTAANATGNVPRDGANR